MADTHPEHLTLNARMEMKVLERGSARTVIRMPVAGNTQTYGRLHGGASAALAETAGSIAATEHAREVAPEHDAVAVGVDLSITHHRAVREGHVVATASPLHAGRTVATYEVAIEDDEGRRVATARLTCHVLRGRR